VRAYHVDDGTVETVAGSGPDEFDRDFKGGAEGDGGEATKALLKSPVDVAVSPDGDLFIADTHNSCIRMVRDGEISTVAGVCGERGYEGDRGPATEALLNRPYGIALSAEGDLYIADTHNHRVRVVFGPF
jgi:sugar lactone lactonase YvrE